SDGSDEHGCRRRRPACGQGRSGEAPRGRLLGETALRSLAQSWEGLLCRPSSLPLGVVDSGGRPEFERWPSESAPCTLGRGCDGRSSLRRSLAFVAPCQTTTV